MLSPHLKDNRCYGYIINRAFYTGILKLKSLGILLVFISGDDIK